MAFSVIKARKGIDRKAARVPWAILLMASWKSLVWGALPLQVSSEPYSIVD
jgi:hypothetical protein